MILEGNSLNINYFSERGPGSNPQICSAQILSAWKARNYELAPEGRNGEQVTFIICGILFRFAAPLEEKQIESLVLAISVKNGKNFHDYYYLHCCYYPFFLYDEIVMKFPAAQNNSAHGT